MPIDTHDFTIPESDFSGLHRAAATYERQNERQQILKQRQEAQKNANATFLLNYLDPKDHLTGTNYDPQIVSGFSDLLAEGSKLATQGADSNMIMMALSPKVSQLSQYAETAKGINARIKSQLSQIPDKAGYDKSKLDELARRTAFYNPDGSMKEISTIDPNNDYVTDAIHLHPDEVTNDAAIDEFVKNSPKFVNTQRVKRTNANGGYELKKSKVTAPSWATVDNNGEIVPRYEVATNEGQPHTADFTDANGKKVTAPIRMVNEKDFDAMMASNPGIADYVKGQVMKANRNVDLNTPQAKNAARAIMYDELKRRGGGGIEDIEETKANPIHITNNYGKGNGELTLNEVYPRIVSAMKDPTNAINLQGQRIGTTMNGLDSDSQKLIFDAFGGRKDNFNETNTFLASKNGVPTLYRVNDSGQPEIKKEFEVGAIPKTIDVKSQIGKNEKGARLQEVGKEGVQSKSYDYNGKTYSQSQIEKGAEHYGISVDDYLKKLGIIK